MHGASCVCALQAGDLPTQQARRKVEVDATDAQARIREQEEAAAALRAAAAAAVAAAVVKAERTANRAAKKARRKAMVEADPKRAAAGAIKREAALHKRALATAHVSICTVFLIKGRTQGLHLSGRMSHGAPCIDAHNAAQQCGSLLFFVTSVDWAVSGYANTLHCCWHDLLV